MAITRAFAGLTASAAAFACLATPALAASAGDSSGAKFVPGELLVQFERGTSPAEGVGIAREEGARVIDRAKIVPRVALLDLPDGLGVQRADRLFSSLDEVSRAQPNFIRRISQTIPTDTRFGELWGLHNTGQTIDPPGSSPPVTGTADADIDAPEAWDLQTGDPTVTVGVIDTGLSMTHPDLTLNVWVNPGELPNGMDDGDANILVDDINGWDFVEDDNSPDDANGHGTHVAGTIGAVGNNALGVTGVNWNVSLMALKAAGADGKLTTARVIQAVQYGDSEGADVLNASFGGGAFSTLERDAIGGFDGLFVAAAGNDADDVDTDPEYPCDYDLANVVCVAATNQFDGLASFSNFGESSVDLAAPGTNTLSTVPSYTPIFSDDFEGALKWTSGGTPNTWAVTTERPFSPTHSLTDSPFIPTPSAPVITPTNTTKKKGCKSKKTKRARKKCKRRKRQRSKASAARLYYVNNTDNHARMTDPISLVGQDGCRLRFNAAHTLSDLDTVRIEGSDDGSDFAALKTVQGSSAGEAVTADLGAFDDAVTFYVRFRLISGFSGAADGVYIDDVRIECAATATNTYGYRNGTSMASPHVAGAAALVLAECPAYSASQLRAALLNNVDSLASLAGKVDTGGRLNLDKAVEFGDTTAAPPCP